MNLQIFSFFIPICIIISLIIIFVKTNNKKRISDKVKSFDLYISVLEYHMKKAYEIVYKDKIFIYSLEGLKINDQEFNAASKEFVILVFKMVGPKLKEEFEELYGNEETLIFNLIEYFNSSFENDQIREQAKENILNNKDIK